MKKQLQRCFQLSLLAKDLGAKGFESRNGRRDPDRVQRIVERLGLLHGLPQKIGQLLSLSENNDSRHDFEALTEGQPSMTQAEAFVEMERQLGSPLPVHFRSVNPRGISASIGQVHSGELHDGRSVAIKIQHPGVAEQIAWDLEALGWLTAPLGDLRRGFDVAAYRSEIGEMLRQETDYRVEARAIEKFRQLTRGWPFLVIPQVVHGISNSRILVTTWIDGQRLSSPVSWPMKDREAFATTLLQLFLKGIFEWGVLHADPHPGNYRFQPSKQTEPPRLGLIDFGCVKQVGAEFANGLSLILNRAIEGTLSSEVAWQGFVQMGFNSTALAKIRPKLLEVARVLSEPLLTDEAFSVTRWDLGARLARLLDADRLTFRTAGPAEMLFVLRAFQGLMHYLKKLELPIRWKREFLACSRHSGQQPRGSQPISSTDVSRTMKSDTLHIEVKDGAKTIVSLTFGAEATEHLEQLMPQELKTKLDRKQIDLETVAHRAQESGFASGELFSWQEEQKTVRVWLA